MASQAEIVAMGRAGELAARGLGTTSPNPVVGCVILDPDGQVVGEGFHAYAGGPHAEIVALAHAGNRARGGTVVVTLEPCDHHGVTGPCSRALIQAGVARVVIGVSDPNTHAAGGAKTLIAAGVEVEVGVRQAEVEAGNIAWLTAVRRHRPYVIWKYAATLDGRSAAADGTSMWISSEAARMDVHAHRSTADAVIVGVGTVLADDPQLTTRNLRDGSLAIRQPLRVVVDSAGRTPADARVRDSAAPTWIATAAELGATEGELGATEGELGATEGEKQVDLKLLLQRLYELDVRAALLEGGPRLAGAFLAGGLVDRVVGYLAPKLLGAGPTALRDAGVGTVADAIELEFVDITRVGPDLRFTALPRKVEG